jgi:hypothetical protein
MLEAQLDEATQPDPRTPPAGQAGNQVATAFWETILKEHGLNDDGFIAEGATDVQTDRLNVFFSEAEGKKYVPRGRETRLGEASWVTFSAPAVSFSVYVLFPLFAPPTFSGEL